MAVARVTQIEPDSSKPGFSYAFVTDFLPFDTVVTLRSGTGFYENMLGQVANPKRIGVALQGKSVRTISEAEFGAITRAGLRETLDPSNAIQLELDPRHMDAESLAMVTAPPEEQERKIVQLLIC